STKWAPGDAQAWSGRPAPTVGALAIHGVVNATTTTITFDLTALPDSTASLLLIPGPINTTAPTSNLSSNPTFDATFEPPKDSDVHVTSAPATSERSGGTSSFGSSYFPPPAAVAPAAPTQALQAPLPSEGVVQQPAIAPKAPVVAAAPVTSQPAAASLPRHGRSTRE